MPKAADEPISRIHIQPYTRDLEILQNYFGDNIGVSPAIRKIIRSWLETNNILLRDRAREIEDMIL